MELKVVAPVDTFGGGRPRVMYDVTAALSTLGVTILDAEMFVSGCRERMDQHEVHTFTVQREDGEAIQQEQGLQQELYERVFFNLMGVSKRGGGTTPLGGRRRSKKRRRRMRLYACCAWASTWFRFTGGSEDGRDAYLHVPLTK